MSFNLNIRHHYNPDDYNHAERLTRGIGEALAMHQQEEDDNRDFENQVAMEGGENIPGESRLGRIKRIGGAVGGAVRRKLPGYNPVPEAEANLRAHPMHSDSITPSRDRPARNTGIGGAIGDEIDVADEPEMERTTIKGPHGQSAIVATKRGREQEAAGISRRDWLFKEGVQQKNRMELEKSKFHAGGIEAENLKQKHRLELLDRKEAIKRQLGSGTLTEYQRRSLELRSQALEQEIDRIGESADASLARTPEPDEIERRIGGRDPERARVIGVEDKRRTDARNRQEQRATGGKKYSADPTISAAQKLWDAHPEIQSKRARPK